MLEDVTIEYPRDLLALQVGHQIDFFSGDARMLRDRIARALPAWSPDMPGYHAVLGMHAFGLEETGDYAAAERAGRRAVELEPRDGWAQHAVAHVMEMQGRQRDGIAWMRGNMPTAGRARASSPCTTGGTSRSIISISARSTRCSRCSTGRSTARARASSSSMIDASALLWRLHLRGIDVGDRWQPLADAWEPVADAGNYAFNDVHAMMAFVGAGRPDLGAATCCEAQDAAMAAAGDNATFTREVGRPVALAIKAFGDGNYAEMRAAACASVRNIAHRFGGSHAQRDLLDLTLIEAALRDGQQALAAALAAERAAVRPRARWRSCSRSGRKSSNARRRA